MKCKKCWICCNAKGNAPTTRCERNAPWPCCTKKNLNLISAFAQSKRQSSEFGTLDLENICAIKSYNGSRSPLTSVFCSCRIRAVSCLCRYCFNGNASKTINSGDLTVAAFTHAFKTARLPPHRYSLVWGQKTNQKKLNKINPKRQQTTVALSNSWRMQRLKRQTEGSKLGNKWKKEKN